MLLDNRAADYDPTNTGSIHYPGVKRMRWIRVRAVWDGVVYPRWQGLIETWDQQWPAGGKDATVTVTATGPFKVANLYDMEGLTFPGQLTSERVAAVLAAAGLSASSIAAGQSTIDAVVDQLPQGSTALPHLLEVEATENGLLYEAADGEIVFEDRHYRPLHSATSVDTIGDGAAGPGTLYGSGGYGMGAYTTADEIPYRDGNLVLDDADVWNQAAVTPAGAGAVAQLADDLASQAAHYVRRISQTSLSSDVNEALASAQYLVGRYGTPSPRIPTLELLPAARTAKWPAVLAAGNSDRFTWKRRADGHVISMDVFVERVSDTVTPGTDWRVVFELSPAVDQDAWVWDESRWDVDTVWVY